MAIVNASESAIHVQTEFEFVLVVISAPKTRQIPEKILMDVILEGCRRRDLIISRRMECKGLC